jgi:tetratricopeptide (TPR) repeat protein
MKSKLKIKVVVGVWGEHVLPSLWTSLSADLDVELLVLRSGLDDQMKCGAQIKVFEPVADMPGFFRDLESHLNGSDLVVALETSQLSSFQALRYSKALDIPCVVIVNEFTPFVYDRFANIKAIKYDICRNADLFIASSTRARRLLKCEGVDEGKILVLDRFLDMQEARFSEAIRTKFRNYVGLKSDELLLTARTSFEKPEGAYEVLKGFRLLAGVIKGGLNRIRLLMIGTGTRMEELKYAASDLGVGQHVIFLAQDPALFWRDVACASELVIWDQHRDLEKSEPLPIQLLKSVSSGCLNLIKSGTIFDDLSFGLPVLKIDHFEAMSLADSISTHWTTIQNLTSTRSSLPLTRYFASSEEVSLVVRDAFIKLVMRPAGETSRDRVERIVEAHKEPLNATIARDIAVDVEEALLIKNIPTNQLAELWRLKGDVHVAMGETEHGMRAFEKAFQTSDRCFRALRGLGYIAWMGHSHAEASTFFKRALAIDPNDYQCLLGMGLVYRRLRMLSESAFWLTRALDFGGVDSSAFSLLIQACVESPESTISLETLESMRENYGDLPSILRGLSHVYLAHGHSEAVKKILTQLSA